MVLNLHAVVQNFVADGLLVHQWFSSVHTLKLSQMFKIMLNLQLEKWVKQLEYKYLMFAM